MEFLKSALPWLTVALCVLIVVVNHIRTEKCKQNNRESQGNYMTEGMCLGLCVGLAVGSEWMSLGMLIGLAIGVLIKK